MRISKAKKANRQKAGHRYRLHPSLHYQLYVHAFAVLSVRMDIIDLWLFTPIYLVSSHI